MGGCGGRIESVPERHRCGYTGAARETPSIRRTDTEMIEHFATRTLLAAVTATIMSAPAGADMMGHGGAVRGIAVSPDGGRILTASFDYTARLFDFSEQRELAVLDAHEGPVNVAAFVPEGRLRLTAGDDGAVLLWDLKSGRLIRSMIGHRHRVTTLAVARDGKSAVSGGWDRQVIVWNLDTGKPIQVIKTASPVNSVLMLPDDRRIVAGLRDGSIGVWRIADGRPEGRLNAHELGVMRIAVSRDGRSLLSSSTNGKIRLWDLVELAPVRTFQPFKGRAAPALDIAPDGKSALAANAAGTLFHFDLGNGRVLREIATHGGAIWALSFARESTFALSAGNDEAVKVWHLETGSRISFNDSDGGGRPTPWLESKAPGARLFRKCAGCHATTLDEPQRSGPHLVALMGRRVGSVQGYNYSKALTEAEFVWNETTLTGLFAQGPDRYLPGTKMPVQRISDRAALTQLIDYIRDLTTRTR